MHTERKITDQSVKHSFTLYPSLSPYRWTLLLYIPLLALTDKQNDRQRNEFILVGLGNLWFFQVN
jgi:hypothetical protein